MTKFSAAQRKTLAKKGEALPDGSFPIRNTTDLKHAERAVGRANPAKRGAVKAHIAAEAKKLGAKPTPGLRGAVADSMRKGMGAR